MFWTGLVVSVVCVVVRDDIRNYTFWVCSEAFGAVVHYVGGRGDGMDPDYAIKHMGAHDIKYAMSMKREAFGIVWV